MRSEKALMMNMTALVSNSEGDMVCMNCKHTFSVVHCDPNPFPMSDTRYCPNCGALVSDFIRLPEGKTLSDLVREDER
ncbi:MAG: hypothetical protein HFJ75_07655 [Eggerthellaceae bacterium]|nr:hypothetical protein [Eggerthellaceae bacterium]